MNRIRELREEIRQEKRESVRRRIEANISSLIEQTDARRESAKEQRAIGDRYYWPIYNLDIRNPNTAEEETRDPDTLLAKYKKLLAEIGQTKTKLKSELANALTRQLKGSN